MTFCFGATVTELQTPWIDFTSRCIQLGYDFLARAAIPITEKGPRDPKVFAALLLCRSISNLRSVLTLIKAAQLVEARTIARCCLENLFYIDALCADKDRFIEEMFAQDTLSKRAVGSFVMKERIYDEEDQLESLALVRKYLRSTKDHGKPSRSLKPRDLAAQGMFAKVYPSYAQLSTDSAHPTILSLGCYLAGASEDKTPIYDLVCNPEPELPVIEETLAHATNAMLGVLIGARDLIGADQDFEARMAELVGYRETLVADRTKSDFPEEKNGR
jgi:hypothetical protein